MQDNANTSRMDIYIENIQKGKHGSDTGAYDAQGRHVCIYAAPRTNSSWPLLQCVIYSS